MAAAREMKNLVEECNTSMTESFRKEELQLFRKGNLWGLGMTDVGGMVQYTCLLYDCNIANTCTPFAGRQHSRCLDSRAVEGAQGPQHVDAVFWVCRLGFIITGYCDLACRTEMVS